MRVLFILFASVPFMLTVHAERQFDQYTCQVSHKDSETAFYLNMGERKDVTVGGWKVAASLKRENEFVEVFLERSVNILDASYVRAAAKKYPSQTRILPVQLEHSFGGRTDVFNMNCYPRDP